MIPQEIRDRMEACPWRERSIGNPYVCTRFWGNTVLCDGACSWVADYNKSKELKVKKEEKV